MSNSKVKKSAMETASAYLANRMHTISETRKHLAGKEYAQSEIDACIEELIALKYLDDYHYALRYYEYSHERKRGAVRAKRELEEKGVDKETIHNAYEDFLFENNIDEYEIAMELAKKEVFVSSDKFGDEGETLLMKEVDDKLIARIARKLESRGFTYDVIHRVMDEVRRMK